MIAKKLGIFFSTVTGFLIGCGLEYKELPPVITVSTKNIGITQEKALQKQHCTAMSSCLLKYMTWYFNAQELTEAEQEYIHDIVKEFNNIDPVFLATIQWKKLPKSKCGEIFSFLNFIFIGSNFFEDRQLSAAAIAHEIMHIEKGHTLKKYALMPLLTALPALLATAYIKTTNTPLEGSMLKRLAFSVAKITGLSAAVSITVVASYYALQRMFEYEADTGFKKYLSQPQWGQELLERYKVFEETPPTNLREKVNYWLLKLCDTHPSATDRLKVSFE